MRQLVIAVALVLSGCFVAPTDPVTCTGTRPMVCDCADSCISSRDDVLVTADPSCTGVTVCWTPDAGNCFPGIANSRCR